MPDVVAVLIAYCRAWKEEFKKEGNSEWQGWAVWEEAEADVAAEGVQAPVPYRGAAWEVLQQLLAGLRSGMSYCNASTIQEMWKNARFVRQTTAGMKEGGPHDVCGF